MPAPALSPDGVRTSRADPVVVPTDAQTAAVDTLLQALDRLQKGDPKPAKGPLQALPQAALRALCALNAWGPSDGPLLRDAAMDAEPTRTRRRAGAALLKRWAQLHPNGNLYQKLSSPVGAQLCTELGLVPLQPAIRPAPTRDR